jgi:hypothetical protein
VGRAPDSGRLTLGVSSNDVVEAVFFGLSEVFDDGLL